MAARLLPLVFIGLLALPVSATSPLPAYELSCTLEGDLSSGEPLTFTATVDANVALDESWTLLAGPKTVSSWSVRTDAGGTQTGQWSLAPQGGLWAVGFEREGHALPCLWVSQLPGHEGWSADTQGRNELLPALSGVARSFEDDGEQVTLTHHFPAAPSWASQGHYIMQVLTDTDSRHEIPASGGSVATLHALRHDVSPPALATVLVSFRVPFAFPGGGSMARQEVDCSGIRFEAEAGVVTMEEGPCPVATDGTSRHDIDGPRSIPGPGALGLGLVAVLLARRQAL